MICADGTWNDPEDERATNVLRVARAIRPADDLGVQQVVFYDWGLGSYHGRLLGRMFGRGLAKNIQDCYRFIVHNHAEGDELFLFGFSRGAYTVRSVAGLLNKCGILGRARACRIPEAYSFYKKRRFEPGSEAAIKWREDHRVKFPGAVRFLGVWETVGARGIPKRMRAFVDDRDFFLDTKLGSNVQAARHALAIDEMRTDFSPTLWSEKEKERMKQVWFVGGHGDVGGDHEDVGSGHGEEGGQSASEPALAWMAAEAKDCGLALESHLGREICGEEAAKRRRRHKRRKSARDGKVREIPPQALVHESVRRCHEELERGNDEKDKYDPEALKSWLEANEDWGCARFVP